jgi:hypothetical protein
LARRSSHIYRYANQLGEKSYSYIKENGNNRERGKMNNLCKGKR